MAGANQYRAQDFIDAIPGTGGVISTIAARVGCAWHTAKKYIDNFATVKQAYDDEVGKVGDLAESIIIKNLQLISQKQTTSGEPIDITDAKWYATVKLPDRGYAPKQRYEHAGAGGGPIAIQRKPLDLTGLDDDELETLAKLARRIVGGD